MKKIYDSSIFLTKINKKSSFMFRFTFKSHNSNGFFSFFLFGLSPIRDKLKVPLKKIQEKKNKQERPQKEIKNYSRKKIRIQSRRRGSRWTRKQRFNFIFVNLVVNLWERKKKRKMVILGRKRKFEEESAL